MTRAQVIEKVKVLIDELTPYSETDVVLAGDALTNPIGSYIEQVLNDATDSVRMTAPAERLSRKSFTGTLTTGALSDTMVYYTLPSPTDFLRIAYVHMSRWKRSVQRQTPAESEEYRLLKNPMTTAGAYKPAVVFKDGILELYGSRTTGDGLTSSNYIAKEYFSDVDLPVDTLVANAICWRCAVEVLSIMGRPEFKQAQEFYQEAVGSLTV